MQGEGVDDQVVVFGGECESVFVFNKGGVGKFVVLDFWEICDNCYICKVFVNYVEMIMNVVGDEVLQEYVLIQICMLVIVYQGCVVG